MPPSASLRVRGSLPSCPETKSQSPALMACESGTRAGGTLSVWTTCLCTLALHEQRVDVVEHRARMEKRGRVDLAHEAGAVDEEHLENVRQLADAGTPARAGGLTPV